MTRVFFTAISQRLKYRAVRLALSPKPPHSPDRASLLRRITTLLQTAAATTVVYFANFTGLSAESTKPPNIVIILADDLEWHWASGFKNGLENPSIPDF
jgi:hypothetical protein